MQFFFEKEKKFSTDLTKLIERACEGLVYISERDAPVNVFVGRCAEMINADALRVMTNSPLNVRVEEVNARGFFTRLTSNEEWHDDAQRTRAKKFLELQRLLEENLRELKVFKIGSIQLRIFAVGLDSSNNVIGIQTEAVET